MTETLLADATQVVVTWAQRLASKSGRPPRWNARLLIDSRFAVPVQAALEAASDATRWFIVRRSSDVDAVTLRNGRPSTAPAGVTSSTPLIYLVFWCPGVPGHDANAQSLVDLDAVSVRDLLAGPKELEFPLEMEIAGFITEALVGWPDAHRDRARHRLVEGWSALRQVIRAELGGREQSLPFVERLEDYVRFLRAIRSSLTGLDLMPPDARYERLLACCGEALPQLGMFRISELHSVLGLPRMGESIPPREMEDAYRRELQTVLAENLDATADYSQLAERIRGKKALNEQIMESKVPFARDPDAKKASEALLRFCTEHDESALEVVEWVYRKDRANRRSESCGLKGFLIQRKVSRRRENPLDRATDATKKALAGAAENPSEPIADWVDGLRLEVVESNARARDIAATMERLAVGEIPASQIDAAVRGALEQAIAAQQLKSPELLQVAKLWRACGPDEETAEFTSDSFLHAVALALAAVPIPVRDGVRAFQIEAQSADKDANDKTVGAPLTLSPTAMPTLESVRLWLIAILEKLAAEEQREREDHALEGEDGADERDVNPSAAGLSFVLRGSGDGGEPFAVVCLTCDYRHLGVVAHGLTDVVRSWESIPARAGGVTREVLTALSRPGAFVTVAPPLLKAWTTVFSELGGDAVRAKAWLLAPLPKSSREFVDTWGELLGRAGKGEQSEITKLEEERDKAIADGDLASAAAAVAKLKVLKTAPATPPMSQSEVRELLRGMTLSLTEANAPAPRSVALGPCHPLVVRQRVLADETLWACIKHLVISGWPEDGELDLRDALKQWGLPAPAYVYGGWWEGDQLTFDDWIGPGVAARFTLSGGGASRDSESLGIARASSVVSNYLQVHPAAGDRLRLRVQADDEGEWAWALLERRDRGGARRTDLALCTSLAQRARTCFERGTGDAQARARFEMADDGSPPTITVRREQAAQPVGDVHLALAVGPAHGGLRPKLERVAPSVGSLRGTWDPRILFHSPGWQAQENGMTYGMPSDVLGMTVANAIAFAEKGASDIYVQRFSFDASVVRPPMEALHKHAHWVVLASRHPLHRAVEAAGTDLAVLLDFRTSIDRGRPVHICTSVGSGQFQLDLKRLEASLSIVLGGGEHGDLARRVVESARRFAPGTAISCTGTSCAVAVQGLVGLLLTRAKAGEPNGMHATLPIDQHVALLADTGGPQGDVLVVTRVTDGIELSVLESKFARESGEALIPKASRQVRTTLARLARYAVEHPLRARVRENLARAIDDQREIAGADAVPLALSEHVRDPAVPLRVASTTSAIWLWSASEHVEDSDKDADGVVVHHRGRKSTQSALDSLGDA